MASLIDRTRTNTHDRRDALKLIDQRILQAQSDMASSKARNAALLGELQGLRPEADMKRKAVTEVEDEISRLERKLAEVRQKLSAAQEEVQREEQKAARLRKNRQEADAATEAASKRLGDLLTQKQEAQKAILAAIRRSLTEFLIDQESRLQGLTMKSLEQKAKVQALERLRSSRHQVSEVASLCEAREEWLRVLREARVPLVQKSAREELTKVETELNRRFPGALEAEAATALDEIEELYLLRKGAKVRLYLPISGETWRAIGDGKLDGGHSEVAARLAWSLRKSLQIDWNSAEIINDEVSGVVCLSADAPEDVADQHIDLSLEGSDTVAFIVSPLPPETAEALNNED